MKKLLFLILLLSSVTSYADNSTIEGLIESYEEAREKGMLIEWQAENRHPHMFANLSELQRKWKKVSDCHNKTQDKAHREKDAMRPRHERVKITEANAATFDGMFVYPVKPEKSVRLYYPKGSFLKGSGFDVSRFNGRWFLVSPLYSDEHIKMFLRTKDHFIYLQSPSCV